MQLTPLSSENNVVCLNAESDPKDGSIYKCQSCKKGLSPPFVVCFDKTTKKIKHAIHASHLPPNQESCHETNCQNEIVLLLDASSSQDSHNIPMQRIINLETLKCRDCERRIYNDNSFYFHINSDSYPHVVCNNRIFMSIDKDPKKSCSDCKAKKFISIKLTPYYRRRRQYTVKSHLLSNNTRNSSKNTCSARQKVCAIASAILFTAGVVVLSLYEFDKI